MPYTAQELLGQHFNLIMTYLQDNELIVPDENEILQWSPKLMMMLTDETGPEKELPEGVISVGRLFLDGYFALPEPAQFTMIAAVLDYYKTQRLLRLRREAQPEQPKEPHWPSVPAD